MKICHIIVLVVLKSEVVTLNISGVFKVHHNVVLQLWNVRRTKNSPTTCKPAITHVVPCLALTLAVGWTTCLWRAVAVRRELT